MLPAEISRQGNAIHGRAVVVSGQVIEVDSTNQVFFIGDVATEECELPASIVESYARSYAKFESTVAIIFQRLIQEERSFSLKSVVDVEEELVIAIKFMGCLLYTSDAADESSSV